MTDTEPWQGISRQSPLVQLIFTFVIVVLAGTIIFYIFLFIGTLISGRGFKELATLYTSGGEFGSGAILRYIQVSVQVSMFLIPGLFIIRMLQRPGLPFLRLNISPDLPGIILTIILAFAILPVMNYTGFLNSKMALPSWLSGVESWIREKEDSASGIIDLLIISQGMFMLVVNVLILAVIPAFSEELMFRGIVQRLLCRTLKSNHAGIIVASVIFSSVHFQFYGFIPRFMLGLSFGYLFFWTRNIWYPVVAHFVYNAIPVVMYYFQEHVAVENESTDVSVNDPGVPWLYIGLSVMVFYYFWRRSRKSETAVV